ncbi:hypothetical protein M9Y10_004152 [Tritrichomonas musculus]|uniref:Sel1 repeat protein n=1 Tax=Tritrichomonas musculus TaxID=1915356 RepID=A0ABR2JRL5_9EUKA
MSSFAGDKEGMYYYATMLQEGNGTPIDKKESSKYFKMSADAGKEAFKYFKMEADEGDVTTMMACAMLLRKGEGVQVDEEEGSRYYKMAADLGDTDAMIYYVMTLEKKDRADFDEEEALKYIKMSADNGNENGCLKFNNFHCIKNLKKALKIEWLGNCLYIKIENK